MSEYKIIDLTQISRKNCGILLIIVKIVTFSQLLICMMSGMQFLDINLLPSLPLIKNEEIKGLLADIWKLFLKVYSVNYQPGQF